MGLAELRAAFAKETGCTWKYRITEDKWYPVGGATTPSWLAFLIQHLEELCPEGFILPYEGEWRHRSATARAEELYQRLYILGKPA